MGEAPAARQHAASALAPADARRTRLAVALLACLAILPYLNAIPLPFVWEDAQYIVLNEFIHSWENLSALWANPLDSAYMEGPYFRPWLATMDIINWQLGGGEPWLFHVSNILVHVACTMLLAALVRRLATPTCALVAAALFAVHPIHTESITRIAGRSDPWCALFVLLALLCVVIAADRPRPFPWTLAAAGAYALGLLSKEMALPLPVLAALWLRTRVHSFRDPTFRRALWTHLPLWIVLGAFLVARLGIIGAGRTPVQTIAPTQFLTALVMLRVSVLYLHLLVWPLPLSIFHNIPEVRGLLDPRVWAALALLAGLTVLFWRRRRQSPIGWWAWVAFWITLGPVSNIVFPLTDPISERFLYLPSAAFCVAAASLVEPLFRPMHRATAFRVGLGALCLIVTLLSVRTVVRNRDYASNYALARSAAAVADRDPGARHNYGHFAHMRGELDLAEREYRAAIQLHPHFPLPVRGLAKLLLEQERYAETVQIADHGLRIAPEHVLFYRYRAEALLGLGDAIGAADAYGAALRIAPGHPSLQLGLVRALRMANRTEDIRRACAEPVQTALDPDAAAQLADFCAQASTPP